MDKGQSKGNWSWLPAAMPQVAKLIAEKRATLGAAWVNKCWQRGVLDGEPGWFFAGEGALMVGTMWDDDVLMAFAKARITTTQALLILRDPEVADGAA